MEKLGIIDLPPEDMAQGVKLLVKNFQNKKKRTTIKDILEAIQKTKTIQGKKIKWFLNVDDHEWLTHQKIRARIGRGHREFCPITFYCYLKTGKFFAVGETVKAANKIGLSDKQRRNLVLTADEDVFCIKSLRKKLLQATGLLEQARNREKRI